VHVDSQLYAFTFVVEKLFNFSQIETHVMVRKTCYYFWKICVLYMYYSSTY